MTNTELEQAIELVEDMVKHGYHLMHYQTAAQFINCYRGIMPRRYDSLDYWKKAHADWLKRMGV